MGDPSSVPRSFRRRTTVAGRGLARSGGARTTPRVPPPRICLPLRVGSARCSPCSPTGSVTERSQLGCGEHPHGRGPRGRHPPQARGDEPPGGCHDQAAHQDWRNFSGFCLIADITYRPMTPGRRGRARASARRIARPSLRRRVVLGGDGISSPSGSAPMGPAGRRGAHATADGAHQQQAVPLLRARRSGSTGAPGHHDVRIDPAPAEAGRPHTVMMSDAGVAHIRTEYGCCTYVQAPSAGRPLLRQTARGLSPMRENRRRRRARLVAEAQPTTTNMRSHSRRDLAVQERSAAALAGPADRRPISHSRRARRQGPT